MSPRFTGDGAFKGAADGGGVATRGDVTVEFRVDSEEVGYDAFLMLSGLAVGAFEYYIFDNGPNAVVYTEAGFVPGVEGEKDGVLGELDYTFG